jgi:hypothetical protein
MIVSAYLLDVGTGQHYLSKIIILSKSLIWLEARWLNMLSPLIWFLKLMNFQKDAQN